MSRRETPYCCQICGQVEQPIWDDDLGMEIYSDPEFGPHGEFYDDDGDEFNQDLVFTMHEYEFKTCRLWIRVCELCASQMDSDQIFERYKERVKAGEILRFH
jgi:hypothetical protein